MPNATDFLRHYYRELKYYKGKLKGQNLNFKIVELNAHIDSGQGHLYNDLYNNKIDAIRIRNFLSEGQIANYVSEFNNLSSKLIYTKPFGFTHGPSLIDSYSTIDSYFETSSKYLSELTHLLKFDFRTKINELLNSLDEHHKMLIPKMDNHEYVIFPMKYMKYMSGSIPAHNGLMFYDIYPECKHIESLINKSNQISILILIQKSEKGGDLEFINWHYRDTPKLEDKNILRHTAMMKPRQAIDLNPGDLILFNGGQLWHRVTNILGKTPRISLSTFSAYSLDNKNILIWN